MLRELDWKRSSPALVTISKDRDKTKVSLFIFEIFRRSYKFLWCPVFKAASTNWMRNLVSLANLTDGENLKLEKRFKRQPNVQARLVAPKISPATLATIERDPSAIRMLTVRHPFTRWDTVVL